VETKGAAPKDGAETRMSGDPDKESAKPGPGRIGSGSGAVGKPVLACSEPMGAREGHEVEGSGRVGCVDEW
jgi:hypothetical protein